MSSSDNSGILMLLMWIVTVIISIAAGVMAWDWVEPESFFGAVGFLIIWGILSKVGHLLAVAIVAILGGLK
jgi:hypothetical protein